MEKFDKLIKNKWFRFVLVVGLSILFAIIGGILVSNYWSLSGLKPYEQSYYDPGNTAAMAYCSYIPTILMYVVCDLVDDLKWKVSRFLRSILFMVSLILYAFFLIMGVAMNIQGGTIGNAIVAGFAYGPMFTYPLMYFFVVGRFEEFDGYKANPITQLIFTLGAYIVPIILGIIIMAIVKAVDNSIVSIIAFLILPALVIIKFISSYKEVGFNLGGFKEYKRDQEKGNSSSSTSTSYSNDEENDDPYKGDLAKKYADMKEWKYKIAKALENCDNHVSCDDVQYGDDGFILSIVIDMSYEAKADPESVQYKYENIVSNVKSTFDRVGNECPFAVQLKWRAKVD